VDRFFHNFSSYDLPSTYILYSRDSVCAGVSRDSPSFTGFKELWALVTAKFGSERQLYRGFPVKYDISDKAREYFEFPTVGENICSSRTIIKRPVRGIGEGEEDVQISDYSVRGRTAKDEKLICTKKKQ
jgi:hypothetical protein